MLLCACCTSGTMYIWCCDHDFTGGVVSMWCHVHVSHMVLCVGGVVYMLCIWCYV